MPRLSKQQIVDIVQQVEETKKDSSFFKIDFDDFAKRKNLEMRKPREHEIVMLWDDVKASLAWREKGREWASKEGWNNTEELESKFREIDKILPIEFTNRIHRWYSIFIVPFLHFRVNNTPAYVLTEEEYSWFFTLKGDTSEIDKLVNYGEYYFHDLLHKLFTYQARQKRREVLDWIMRQPEILEKIKTSTFVVPIGLQYILATPQVYNYYMKLVMNGIKLPLKAKRAPTTSKRTKDIFQLIKKKIDEGYDYDTAMAAALGESV